MRACQDARESGPQCDTPGRFFDPVCARTHGILLMRRVRKNCISERSQTPAFVIHREAIRNPAVNERASSTTTITTRAVAFWELRTS